MNRAEKRSQKRKEVVEAVTLRKEPVELVARVYNIPLRTVFDWLARYRQGGWHALIEKTRQGRPKKITGDDMKWLYDAITMGNPLNYKLPFCLWSLNNIRALLQKERAVILSKSSICRLLGHLGLTPQKPLYKSYKLRVLRVFVVNKKFLIACLPAFRGNLIQPSTDNIYNCTSIITRTYAKAANQRNLRCRVQTAGSGT